MPVPETMRAVVLDAYSGPAGLRLDEVPTPRPGPGEVLIEVAGSPINPSDLAFLEGNYVPRPPTPTRPGLEGAGRVVEAGPGLMGRYLKGKRVAFIAGSETGAWAEYVVVPNGMALPLGAGVSLESGAMSVVNPMTALALLDLCRERRCRAVVNTAAAGALGRMIDRIFGAEGIEVINVVRRPEQVESLRARGVKHVLDSSAGDFEASLRERCKALGATLAFDAVGGSLTGQLLAGLERGSTVMVYGGLSEQPSRAEIGDLIFSGKTLTGFWLSRWIPAQGVLKNLRTWRRVQGLLEGSLRSELRSTFPLEKAAEAVVAYQGAMSAGKVLLVPQAG
ncbi:MAG: zinc-binding dehydrogenase [Deltaproteobacteria bacterium]|nr:zinc-binding dehydrogenase [Deltaproteobacteria bacterium]